MVLVTVLVVAGQWLWGTWSNVWRMVADVPVTHAVLETPSFGDDETSSSPVMNLPHADTPRKPVVRDVLPPAAEEVLPAEPSANKEDPQRGAPARTIAFGSEAAGEESPFDKSLWESEGWEFSDDSMTSVAGKATASFRRSYQRLMVECDVVPLEKPGTPLRLRLLAADSKTVVTFALHEKMLAVTDDSRSPSRLIKQVPLSPELAPDRHARLRIAGTGNRLVVSWNGKVVLTCDQPAGQSGRAVQLEFLAERTPYRVSTLRIEGE